MIDYAHDLSIVAWQKTLKKASSDELEMLYLCLSNGLLNVVLDGYDRFDRQTVIQFVEQMYCQAVAPFSPSAAEDACQAVSYTHLDVYKRQSRSGWGIC